MMYEVIAEYLGVLEELESGNISENELDIMLADNKGLGIEEVEDFYNFLKDRLHVDRSQATKNLYVGYKRSNGAVWLDKVKVDERNGKLL